jgi:purine nucleosidase
MDERRPVLLDTDIGNDIDDAVCLAYLLAQPRCDLLGVTTVSAEPVQRARLVSVLCRIAGRAVPILPGAADPLVTPPVQGPPPQAVTLDRWDHDESYPGGEAVEFLRRTIRAHPGEVTLLSIGPLTNVALLFAVDPQIPALLREWVLMGGSYTSGPREPEWNIHCDPYAAALAFAAPVARTTAIGLDVTNRVRMDARAFLDRCDTPLLRPVADMAGAWFGDRTEVTFHDPLAAATVFEPALCAYETGEVIVQQGEGPLAGFTSWRPAGDGPHRTATDVRPDAFLEHYWETVDSAAPRP